MKRCTSILVLIIGVFILAVFLWDRSDDRLTGSYVPDVEATYPVWNHDMGFSRESVEAAFQQIFNSQPMVYTDHEMTFFSGNGTKTNRFVILWKNRTSSVIAFSYRSFYRLEFTSDGLWIYQKRIFGYPRYALAFKMKKQSQPKER